MGCRCPLRSSSDFGLLKRLAGHRSCFLLGSKELSYHNRFPWRGTLAWAWQIGACVRGSCKYLFFLSAGILSQLPLHLWDSLEGKQAGMRDWRVVVLFFFLGATCLSCFVCYVTLSDIILVNVFHAEEALSHVCKQAPSGAR
jgi:hypothetical protein